MLGRGVGAHSAVGPADRRRGGRAGVAGATGLGGSALAGDGFEWPRAGGGFEWPRAGGGMPLSVIARPGCDEINATLGRAADGDFSQIWGIERWC